MRVATREKLSARVHFGSQFQLPVQTSRARSSTAPPQNFFAVCFFYGIYPVRVARNVQ